VEDHNQVHLEFYLELLVDERRARVNLWEQHIKRNLKAANHVAISHLDVLDLSSVGFSLKGFDSNELDFDRLYLKI